MNRNFFVILISSFLFTARTYSQYSGWINYTNSGPTLEIVNYEEYLWIATSGGLVRMNKYIENLTFYNKANAGLPENTILSLAIDKSGNIWIGTNYLGVGVFDGEKCINYNRSNSGLPCNGHHRAIAIDNEGNVWISALRWLAKFDGEHWISYETGNPEAAYVALNDIKFDKYGYIWIGASWGLGRFDGVSLKEYSEVKYAVNTIAFDKNDNLWLGTEKKGLIKFNRKIQAIYDTSNTEIPSNKIYSMKVDSKGNLWLATNKGLCNFDGLNWKVYDTKNSGLLENTIFCLEIDNQDNIWLGLWHKGLQKFDGTNWKHYNLSNSGLMDNYLLSLALDTYGHKWIACHDHLIKFDGIEWKYYNQTDFKVLDNYFKRAYDGDERKIWTGQGVLVYYDSTEHWRVYDINNLHKGNRAKIDKEGNIWYARNDGLHKFDGENWTIFNKENSPLPSNMVAKLAIDQSGNLLISTLPYYFDESGVLMSFDGHSWKIIYTCKPNHWISGLEIDREGAIWIGILDRSGIGEYYGDGLKKFNGKYWTSYYSDNSGLPSNSVIDLALDKDDNLWIGTYFGGLAKFNRENEWTVFNTLNSGLPRDNVELIEIDSLGNKWLYVQNCGLTVCSPDYEIQNPDTSEHQSKLHKKKVP